MKGQRVAYRYAKSLLNLAVEQNMLEEAYTDMKRIAATCNESRDFVIFLRSPVVKADKKMDVINKVFGNSLHKLSAGFINIITTHRRESVLAEIANSFVDQYRKHKKIAKAEVITAVKLDDALKAKIIAAVHKSEGKEVEISEKVDPSIIGGLIVRVGDKQYDGSIIRKLKSLKKDFSQNAYVSQL